MVDKHQAINKIGHALHEHNELFKHITYQKVIADLCASLCLEHPLVVQSMAILKPPRIGGPVTLHQDSTFLYDYPESLIGFWMPLQDAGKDNGCLWGIPGTHQGKLYKRSKVINGVAQMEIIEEMDVD